MLILSPSHYTHSNTTCGKIHCQIFASFSDLPDYFQIPRIFRRGGGEREGSGHPDKFRVPCNSVSKACYVKVVLFYILSYSKFLSFSQTVRLVKDVSGYRRCVGRDVLAREIRTANTQAHTHKYNT